MIFRRVFFRGILIVLAAGSVYSQDSDDIKIRYAPLEKHVISANRNYSQPDMAANKVNFRQHRLVIPEIIDDILVADFNRDAIPDIAYTSYDESNKKCTLVVLQGDKNLNFKRKYEYSINRGWPQFVGAADFNGNGKLDIAVVGYIDTYFLIYPGKGNCQFEKSKAVYAKDPWTWDYFAMAHTFDFDGDGKQDIIELYWYDKVIAFRNLGDFKFEKYDIDTGFGFNCDGIATADFTDDRKDDLFTVDVSDHKISFFESKGDGTFAKSYTKEIGLTGDMLFPAYLNKDSKLDLIGSGKTDGEAWTMLGKGKGQLGSKSKLPGRGSMLCGIATGDFNSDKKLDIMSPEGTYKNNEYSYGIWYYQGRGTGQFKNPVELAPYLRFDRNGWGTSRQNISVADFNKDGKLDVLGASYFGYDTANPDSQSLVFFLNGKSPAVLKISNLTIDRLEFENSDIIMKGRFDYTGSNLYLYYDKKSKEATENAFLTFNIKVLSPYYNKTYFVSGSFLDKRTRQSGTIEFNLKLPTTVTSSYQPNITVSDFYLYDHNLVRSNKLR